MAADKKPIEIVAQFTSQKTAQNICDALELFMRREEQEITYSQEGLIFLQERD